MSIRVHLLFVFPVGSHITVNMTIKTVIVKIHYRDYKQR